MHVNATTQTLAHHLVGVGASAGGLESLQRLFADMPADSDLPVGEIPSQLKKFVRHPFAVGFKTQPRLLAENECGADPGYSRIHHSPVSVRHGSGETGKGGV